jgi:hypothetical protein
MLNMSRLMGTLPSLSHANCSRKDNGLVQTASLLQQMLRKTRLKGLRLLSMRLVQIRYDPR